MLRSNPPRAGIRKMPEPVSVHLTNAIALPSGDHAGLIHMELWCVRRSSRSDPIDLTYRSNRWGSPVSPFQANATWLPSGENVGATACPGKLVKGTTCRADAEWVTERRVRTDRVPAMS